MSELPFHVVFRTITRDRLKMSQGKIAEQCGADHSYISRLCTGDRKPSRDFLDNFCRVFSLTDAERTSLYNSAGFTLPTHQRMLEKLPPAFVTFMQEASEAIDLGIYLDERPEVMGTLQVLRIHIRLLIRSEENKRKSIKEDRLQTIL